MWYTRVSYERMCYVMRVCHLMVCHERMGHGKVCQLRIYHKGVSCEHVLSGYR